MWQYFYANAAFKNNHICGNLTSEGDVMDTMKRVRELIDARGISLNKLATISGLKVSTLQMAEARGTQLSIDTIERICAGLGITLAEFFSTNDYQQIVAPKTVAAHTDGSMTPELEARIQELIKEAFEKYGKK